MGTTKITGSSPSRFLAPVVLVGAVVAAYLNSVHGAFVWDDINSIVQNPLIRHFSTVFDRPVAVNTTSGRPLVGLSLALNYALGGLNPLGYHLFNVLVHAAAALALFGFVRRLARLPRWGGRYEFHATGLALAVAAVWALHPLQTEAVSYVIQRSESLMGLCYLLTLYCFIRAAGGTAGPWTTGPRTTRPCADGSQSVSAEVESVGPQGRAVRGLWSRGPVFWYAGSVLACAVGMTAKEVMVSAPVMVLLFDRTFLAGSFRRALASKKWFYGALFATWLILFWLVASLGFNRGGSTGGFSERAPWLAYWLTQFPAIATYLKLTFFPHPLIFQYGPFWLPDAAAALPTALVVVPLVGLTVVALWRWPAIGFFGFWFFSVLAVTSIVPGISDMIVEHRMYLALAPLWILVAAGLHRWRPRVAVFGLGIAAVAFGAVTVARNRVYRGPIPLWTDNIAKRPNNALTRYNFAVALQRAGRDADAQAQLEAAVKLRPDFAEAQYNLALLLAKLPGHADQAIAHYQAAIRIDPRQPRPHINLAVLLHQRGEDVEACRQLQLAVECDPSNRAIWLDWVRALVGLHRPADAIDACASLVRAHPGFAAGQAELGFLLASSQRPAEAIPHLEAAIRLDPTQTAARFYLGSVLVGLGERLPEAVALLQEVVRQQPDAARIRFNLGTAYMAEGHHLADAIAQFTAAVRLDPKFAEARFNLAVALETEGGHREDAISEYRMAASLEPGAPAIHFRLASLLAEDPRTRPEARAEVEKTLALDPGFPGAQALREQLNAAGR